MSNETTMPTQGTNGQFSSSHPTSTSEDHVEPQTDHNGAANTSDLNRASATANVSELRRDGESVTSGSSAGQLGSSGIASASDHGASVLNAAYVNDLSGPVGSSVRTAAANSNSGMYEGNGVNQPTGPNALPAAGNGGPIPGPGVVNGAPNGRPNNNNNHQPHNRGVPQNPLFNVRDRLFHALFYRIALAYARAFPKPVRRFMEFAMLLKVSSVSKVEKFARIDIYMCVCVVYYTETII